MSNRLNRREFVKDSLIVGAGLGTGFIGFPAFLGGAQNRQFSSYENRRLRVVQIGTVHPHAWGKMLALRALPDYYDVVAFSDPDPEEQSKWIDHEAYSGIQWVDCDKIFSYNDLDVVVIETAIEDAPEMAKRALTCGLHVHLDKPGAIDHQEFVNIRQQFQEKSLVFQMGYMLRHLPAMQFLFDIVKAGWIGEITEIETYIGNRAHAGIINRLQSLPGGGMFDVGCHLIDLVVYLLGNPEKVHSISTPSRAGMDAGIVDNQLAVFKYPLSSASIRCNLADPFGFSRRRFSVVGTNGTIELAPLESGHIRLSLEYEKEGYPKGYQELEMPYQHGRYGGEFLALFEAITGISELPWDARHDIAVHAASLRAGGVELP